MKAMKLEGPKKSAGIVPERELVSSELKKGLSGEVDKRGERGNRRPTAAKDWRWRSAPMEQCHGGCSR